MGYYKHNNSQDILGSLRTGGMDTALTKASLASW